MPSRRYAALAAISPKDVARFESYVDKSAGPDACWPWTGSHSRGYGHATVAVADGRVTITATRLFWMLANGSVPSDGLNVCHRCDNPPCCNPAHLFLGTVADNMADMAAKGRASRTSNPRKAHCRNGHPLAGDNLLSSTNPSRRTRGCRACSNGRARQRYRELGKYRRKHVTLTYGGQTMILEHWAKELGVSPTTITSRIKSGWTVERALTTPVRRPTGEGHNVYVPLEKAS